MMYYKRHLITIIQLKFKQFERMAVNNNLNKESIASKVTSPVVKTHMHFNYTTLLSLHCLTVK